MRERLWLAMGLWAAMGAAMAGPARAKPPESPALKVPAGAPIAAPPGVAIPDALRPWVGWALYDSEDALCPVLDGMEEGGARCAWPSSLQLALDDKGGRFTQQWRVRGAATPVLLPGDAKHWPQDVKLDGRPAIVTLDDGAAAVQMPPGDHTVSGVFAWDDAPESLHVPPETGLLSLTVRGKKIDAPGFDAEGQVWLEKKAEAEKEADVLEVAVHRMVADEIPLRLTTNLELRVSGRSREVVLGRALPEGFVPMSLDGPLPARLEPDNRLRVQVRPGTWALSLVARHEGPVTSLARPAPDGPWKEGDEVWVFAAHPELRVVTVEGVPAIDPQQTTLPNDWKRLPTYAIKVGDTMKLVEVRRGDAEPRPDALGLKRELWLDFDGGGWTARDTINGSLSRSWRLEVLQPTQLGRVSVSATDQFITLGEGGRAGVEVRQGAVSVSADSRLPAGGDLPAVSWDADFHDVCGTLHLPPGWRLLHARGVDEVPGTWFRLWSLLDIFLVLIIALTIARLYGWPWAALAMAALAITFTEPGAPRWAWLFLLASEALVRLLPEGRVATMLRFVRLGMRAALVILAVAFAVVQVRQGIHPALATEGVDGLDRGERVERFANLLVADKAAAPAAEPMQQALEQARGGGAAAGSADEPSDAKGEEGKIGGKVFKRSGSYAQNLRQYVQEYDPNQMVQTGPGLPRWTWGSLPLKWNGPVERTQRLVLYLLPPWANFVLALLRVALLALMVLRLIESPARGGGASWPRLLVGAAPALALLTLLPAGTARADVPPKEVLDQLRERLLKEPECRPHCVTSPRLALEASPSGLQLRMEIDAAAPTGAALPGGAEQWLPESVFLDGKPAAALLRKDGHLWIEVPAGSHQLLLTGALPSRDTVQIALPLKPHRVEARATGWRLDGVHEDGLADDDLQLTRERGAAGGERQSALQPGALPPFVRVERRITLGLVWQAETTVVRLTPSGSAVVVEVPLLAGESVTSADVRVAAGKALVNMGAGTTSASWRSLLKETTEIALAAPDKVPWTEVWQLEASPIWHVALSGIPVVHQLDDAGVRRPEWHPWPGETVTIAVSKPKGIPGQTLTVDGSTLTVRPGLRATDVTLGLDLRASRGGRHELTLPEGAVVQSLSIAGQSQPIRQDKGKLLLPVLPGSQHVDISWRQPDAIRARFVVPAVDLGAPSVNADQNVELGEDRWVLLAGGPRLGPAVLFWSVLLVIALVAAGLGRVRWTPLRARHWLLLGLGLSQVPLPAAAVVAGWLLALGWRSEKTGTEWSGRALFNVRQLLLVAWTLIALGVLVVSIHEGLLGRPEMQIEGNGSDAWHLRWYTDRVAGALPQPWVISVPILVYRAAMLLWALWIAVALLGWLRWAWTAFTKDGMWKRPPSAPQGGPKGEPRSQPDNEKGSEPSALNLTTPSR